MPTKKIKVKRWGPDRIPIAELDDGIFKQIVFLTEKDPPFTHGSTELFLPLQLLKIEHEVRRFLRRKGIQVLQLADNLAKQCVAVLSVPDRSIFLPALIDNLNKSLGRKLRGYILDAIDIVCCMPFALTNHKLTAALQRSRSPEAIFIIGQAWTRFQVRPYEGAARAGRPVLENLSAGRAHGVDRYADAHERHYIWSELAKPMKGSFSSIGQRVARKINADPTSSYEANPHTIRRYLAKIDRQKRNVPQK